MKPKSWRMYKSPSGRSPVVKFFETLSDAEYTQVHAAMKVVASLGTSEARHLRGEIYEVRANCDNRAIRVLFSNEGRHHQILLALEGFEKKTQKTPSRTIDLAEARLANWRQRARPRSIA
jgi:phage-related protein